MTIQNTILQNLQSELGDCKHVYIAYSGGLDSSVLLHALAGARLEIQITAVHIHHGLSDFADTWMAHCAQQCELASVPFVAKKVSLIDNGKGLEAAARKARLEVFERLLEPGDIMLTAHHMLDQVETFFYRLLRGSGLQGLSAMASARKLGKGKMVRPMLSLRRQELEEYAHINHLTWVEDDSNTHLHFDRNYIRHKILPVIQTRWSAMDRSIATAVNNVQNTKALLDDYIDEDLLVLDCRHEKIGQSICGTRFNTFSILRKEAVLRRWCERLGYFSPERKVLAGLEGFLLAKPDAQPCLRWGHVQLRRFNQRVYLLPVLSENKAGPITWDTQTELHLANGFKLALHKRCDACCLDSTSVLTIKLDEKGVRCKPFGRTHSQSLKRLFQEYRIEPWLRPFVPLVYLNGELTWVGNYWQCDLGRPRIDIELAWTWSDMR